MVYAVGSAKESNWTPIKRTRERRRHFKGMDLSLLSHPLVCPTISPDK